MESPSDTSTAAAFQIDLPPPHEVACLPPAITTNPYQRLLYTSLSARGITRAADGRLEAGWLWRARRRQVVLHFHWPQSYYWAADAAPLIRRPLSWLKLGIFGLRLGFAKALGYRVAWTVHQVYPHERAPGRLDSVAARVLGRAADVLIAHDAATAASIAAELPGAAGRVTIIPHGSYVGVYPEGRPRELVRAELGLRDEFVFLSFGHVRGYKGIERLLRAFGSLERENVALVVAGLAPDAADVPRLRHACAEDPRIKLLLEFVPDERVAELFAAADAVVVPRADGGTSGALILALSLGCPVVAARTPAYSELVAEGRAGWLFDPADETSLARTLAEAVDDPALAAKRRAASAIANRLRWSDVAERTVTALRAAA